jgi:hypothetical protein
MNCSLVLMMLITLALTSVGLVWAMLQASAASSHISSTSASDNVQEQQGMPQH